MLRFVIFIAYVIAALAITEVGMSVLTTVDAMHGTPMNSISVNRTHKGDRLPVTISPQSGHDSAPSSVMSPARHIPIGCEPAFSPIADRDRAQIFGRCTT